MKLNNKKIKILITVTIILILVAAAGVCLFLRQNNKGSESAAKGVVGVVSDDWETGLDDKPSSESSSIQIPGYSSAKMKEGDTSLHLSIGNPEDNNCGFYATLMLNDGTILYKSEMLKPGYGLTEIPLSKILDRGEYNAIVYYECVTLDKEHVPLNAAESEFVLTVE